MFKVNEHVPLPSDHVPYVDEDYTHYLPKNLKKKFDLIFNDVKFKSAPYCNYKHDYLKIARAIEGEKVDAKEAYRYLLRNDLWFLIYFGMGVSVANHPFVVNMCRVVEDGPNDNTLDVWSRDHFKSTIITQGLTIQEILRNPEITILILCYTQKLAQGFYSNIQRHFETNEFLRYCFDDIIPDDVKSLGKKQWTEDGFNVIRRSVRKEYTLSASGLIDGMPTGTHVELLIYDDISTHDLSKNPKTIEDVKNAFHMSVNLGTDGTRTRVIGTFYHYADVLCHLRELKKVDGTPAYHTRIVPATIDGSVAGDGVLLSKARLDKLRLNQRTFAMQNLCNPVPFEAIKLDPRMLRKVSREDLPKNMFKFMVVDPARGERDDGREQDRWAMFVVGVEPYLTDTGLSKVYLLDGVIERFSIDNALDECVKMYLRNGWIHKLGVEQVGQSTMEIHVATALKARGRIVNVKNGMLHVLKPKKRSKVQRIEENLAPALNHGLVFVTDGVPQTTMQLLQDEMERFPLFSDDGIDALSYVWDLIQEYHLPVHRVGEREEEVEREWSRYDRAFNRARGRNKRNSLSWMSR